MVGLLRRAAKYAMKRRILFEPEIDGEYRVRSIVTFVLFMVAYLVLTRWLLPKLGVPT